MKEEFNDALSPVSRGRESVILFILAAVQFTTIVDFMIVMPLGPELTKALNVNQWQFGLIVSSYTFAAGAAGFIASAIVDRFPRRTTFFILYAGFLIGTFLCALAPNYEALVAARIATGAFGGILGGMAMTIVGDVFPEHRRGRATGKLMAGFALASIAGVPLGLYLGTKFSWHVPFIALVLGGIPALILIPFALPALNAHVGKRHAHPLRSMIENFTHPDHLNAFVLTTTLMIGSFSVFPYVSNYFVANVGIPKEHLPFMYILGGCLTLIASPIVGYMADRFGKLKMYRIIAPLSAILLLTITHLPQVPTAVAVAVFGALMVSNVGRMIPITALITSSVEPQRRGGFLSANASVQHIACGLAASIGGAVIVESTDKHLQHFGTVGWIAAGTTLLSLILAGRVRSLSTSPPVSAEKICFAAAAEAVADDAEPLVGIVNQD